MLQCPRCKKETQSLTVQYECSDGHIWVENVVRPEVYKDPPPPEKKGMKMPFGKYKGQPLEDLPIDYIKWLLENIENLRDDLREELQNQVELKEGRGVVRQKVRREGKKFHFEG